MAQSPLLTIQDNQLIGELVVAFGYLEHELIRAAIGVCGGPDHISEQDNTKIENVLESGAALSGRLEVFCGLARKHKTHSKNVIGNFERDMKEGVKWRNMVCHGLWQRISTGQLRVTFYSKGCVKTGSPSVAAFTQEKLREMTKVTLETAEALSSY